MLDEGYFIIIIFFLEYYLLKQDVVDIFWVDNLAFKSVL